MLNFNALLTASGVDPAKVRLVRHRDPIYNRAIYDDAMRRNPRFEQYQSGQGNPRVIKLLQSANVLAAFVVNTRGQTVFVGLWQIHGSKDGYVQDPYRKPVLEPQGASVIFNLTRMDLLDTYAGRVIVEWGGGERAWVQYANRQDKLILELRREVAEEPFPGFSQFTCRLNEVDGLPSAWQEPLRGTRGVYLIVDRETGRQYVGSAISAEGFIGRWRHYANGHGGNVGMRELSRKAEDYEVCILETAGSALEVDEIYALETLWKKKLGSRVQGLNRN